MSLYYYVDDFVGDKDDAFGFFSVEPFLSASVGFYCGYGFLLAGCCGEVEGESHFAVESDWIGEVVFDEHFFVVGGPHGLADTGGVPQLMVYFFGYVRCKGSKEDGEGFDDLR